MLRNWAKNLGQIHVTDDRRAIQKNLAYLCILTGKVAQDIVRQQKKMSPKHARERGRDCISQ